MEALLFISIIVGLYGAGECVRCYECIYYDPTFIERRPHVQNDSMPACMDPFEMVLTEAEKMKYSAKDANGAVRTDCVACAKVFQSDGPGYALNRACLAPPLDCQKALEEWERVKENNPDFENIEQNQYCCTEEYCNSSGRLGGALVVIYMTAFMVTLWK